MSALIRFRTNAFHRQNGRCYYCDYSMWSVSSKAYAQQNQLTLGQAKQFQCTAEHLIAQQDGGTTTQSNIVAACRYCNMHRHARKNPLEPGAYRMLVQKRLRRGKWNHPFAKIRQGAL